MGCAAKQPLGKKGNAPALNLVRITYLNTYLEQTDSARIGKQYPV